jgi:hypothetical protein
LGGGVIEMNFRLGKTLLLHGYELDFKRKITHFYNFIPQIQIKALRKLSDNFAVSANLQP